MLYHSTAVTKDRVLIVITIVIVLHSLSACGTASPTSTPIPILVFPPQKVVADGPLTGEELAQAWGILPTSQGLPEWQSFRAVVAMTDYRDDILWCERYERLNSAPPKSQNTHYRYGTIREVQIGQEYWQYQVGKKQGTHFDFPYLEERTGLDTILSAQVTSVEFVGEEEEMGFRAQCYEVEAIEPPGEFAEMPIQGEFCLSTDYRFVLSAEWTVFFGMATISYELTDIDIPLTITLPSDIEW